MEHLNIISKNQAIKFILYKKEAPITCRAIINAIPFKSKAVQARFAGEES